MSVNPVIESRQSPDLRALLELVHPITWFPPMWAYACGIVASGIDPTGNWPLIIIGIVLAGPIVCGMSQAANDWCDRHVDAINEPDRPIPSGRIPGRMGFFVALVMTALAVCVGAMLGKWGFYATLFGIAAAWAYSAEPIRLKKSGWWGPGTVGLCYEGLPWFTGAAVMAQALPDNRSILIALLYALGAHGIMTLNDFKALDGDRATGVNSLPVTLGPKRAASLACFIMAGAQILVIAALLLWGKPVFALAIAGLLALQIGAMLKLLRDPKTHAPWYNGTGVLLYVAGMMIAAFAVRSLITVGV